MRPCSASRIKDGDRSTEVRAMGPDPITDAPLNRRDSREVKAPINAIHRLGNELRIRDITSDELNPGRNIRELPSRKVVKNANGMLLGY